MRVIQKQIKKDSFNYFLVHMKLVNIFMDSLISEKEMEVLAATLSLDQKIIGVEPYNPFARKKIREKLKISSAGLSNHLRSLIDKGILVKDEVTNRINIREFIIPSPEWQGYQFKVIREKDED